MSIAPAWPQCLAFFGTTLLHPRMQRWQQGSGLASIRDAVDLAKLPAKNALVSLGCGPTWRRFRNSPQEKAEKWQSAILERGEIQW